MIKWIVILCLALNCGITYAHQADVSTTMLVEKGDNQWIVQVRSSLTAFQYQIKSQCSDSAYTTPEEFQELVANYVKDNLIICFNGQDTVTLSNGYVKIGHETNVVFEVSGTPETIHTAYVKNSSFRDIHRNQSALLILKKGFTKKQFLLTDNNNHTVNLSVDKSQMMFIEKDPSKSKFNYIIGFVILLAIGVLIYLGLKHKK